MRHVRHVAALEDFILRVAFDNGEVRLFDVKPLLARGVFVELSDAAYFRSVRAVSGGVAWPNEQDLSADTLYLRGIPEIPSKHADAPT